MDQTIGEPTLIVFQLGLDYHKDPTNNIRNFFCETFMFGAGPFILKGVLCRQIYDGALNFTVRLLLSSVIGYH